MHGYKNTNFKIAFTGIMLGLILLFQYLEKFMPFGSTFIKINVSLIFIMATAYVADIKWAASLLIFRFVLGPAVGSGYNQLEMWSHFVLLTFGVIYMISFCWTERICRKYLKLKKLSTILFWSGVSAITVTTVLGTILNGLFFTPGYWWVMGSIDSLSLSSAKVAYQYVKTPFFFGIPNYWGGIFAVYISGNLLKYGIVTIGFIALWRFIKIYHPKNIPANKL